jgi:hypothetical protein
MKLTEDEAKRWQEVTQQAHEARRREALSGTPQPGASRTTRGMDHTGASRGRSSTPPRSR